MAGKPEEEGHAEDPSMPTYLTHLSAVVDKSPDVTVVQDISGALRGEGVEVTIKVHYIDRASGSLIPRRRVPVPVPRPAGDATDTGKEVWLNHFGIPVQGVPVFENNKPDGKTATEQGRPAQSAGRPQRKLR